MNAPIPPNADDSSTSEPVPASIQAQLDAGLVWADGQWWFPEEAAHVVRQQRRRKWRTMGEVGILLLLVGGVAAVAYLLLRAVCCGQ